MAGGTWPQLAAATRADPVYWGVSTSPASTEAFIESLPGHARYSVQAVTFQVSASGANKIYFARQTRYGTPVFTVGGFAGGFLLFATGISVINSFGLTTSYSLYESVSAGLGDTTVTAT